MSVLTRDQFIEEVLRVVPEKFPLVKLARGDASFSLTVNGSLVPIEDLYRQSLLWPKEMRQSIERWVVELLRATEGSPDRTGSFEDLKDRILPMVLAEEKVDSIHGQTLKQTLLPGLQVGYAIDGDRNMIYIPRGQFESWNVPEEEVHEAAIANLVARSEAIAAQAAQDESGRVNLIIFQTGDGYDASRILLPTLHERLCEYLGSPFFAAIPNREILLCFRNEEETVTRLQSQVAEDYRRMPHQVTDKLFLITADGIAPRSE
jgi:hypothetical protein